MSLDLFGNPLGDITPTYARVKELFLTIDGFGQKVYTLDEIHNKVKEEGFPDPPHKSTISRWCARDNWEAERQALIAHAVQTQALKGAKNPPAKKSEALNSMMELARYVERTGEINARGLGILERWLSDLEQKPTLSEKEASVVARVVEATGKIQEKLLEKLEAKNEVKASARDLAQSLQGGVIDIEIC